MTYSGSVNTRTRQTIVTATLVAMLVIVVLGAVSSFL